MSTLQTLAQPLEHQPTDALTLLINGKTCDAFLSATGEQHAPID
ncbi:hypothetical protein [Xylella taiwanensis]|nr:hypothetical protein [Xylella taiwanensis]